MSKRYSAFGYLVLDGDRQDSGLDPEIATAIDVPTAEKIALALENFDGGQSERAEVTRLSGMNEVELANIEFRTEKPAKSLPAVLTPYHGGSNG